MIAEDICSFHQLWQWFSINLSWCCSKFVHAPRLLRLLHNKEAEYAQLARSSVMSSGTVGAAMEGAIAGKMGIALSFPFFNGWENWTQEDIDSAVQVSTPAVYLHSTLGVL